MADAVIPGVIPTPVGTLTTDTFRNSAEQYDVAIGGIPFIAAFDSNNPLVWQTADAKKDQVDIAPEAGEQSLGYWWIRSQATFHGGAGLLYFEPAGGQDEASRTRFLSSRGVDVWTPGVVTRLPDTARILTTGSTITAAVAASLGGADYTLVAVGTTLTRVATDGTTTAITWGGTDTIQSIVTDGSNYYAGTATGIYSGPVDGSVNGALAWNTGGTPVVLGWVKQRLMAGIGNSLYELTGTGPALPTATHTQPNADWRWTAFAESPTSILAAGYAEGNSAIYRLDLDTSGATPVLTAGAIAVQMPGGERVYSLVGYLGGFVGIGGSSGIWVGQFDNFSGALQLLPRVVQTASPVLSIAGRDRFLFAAVADFEGESGLIRVDLSNPVDKANHLAYATDLVCDTAQTGDVPFVGVLPQSQRLVFGVDAYGLMLEGTAPGTARPAWIKTSRIRFSTVEPKLFKRLLITSAITGNLTVKLEAPDRPDGQILSQVIDGGLPEFALSNVAEEWISLTFQWDAGELRSYQIKALPAAVRQDNIQLTVSLYDHEQDRFGNRFGREGYALERFNKLKALERSADEVSFEWFLPEATLSTRVVIDKTSLVQMFRPTPANAFGGFLTIALRTIA